MNETPPELLAAFENISAIARGLKKIHGSIESPPPFDIMPKLFARPIGELVIKQRRRAAYSMATERDYLGRRIFSYREIGKCLGVSATTASNYVRNVATELFTDQYFKTVEPRLYIPYGRQIFLD